MTGHGLEGVQQCRAQVGGHALVPEPADQQPGAVAEVVAHDLLDPGRQGLDSGVEQGPDLWGQRDLVLVLDAVSRRDHRLHGLEEVVLVDQDLRQVQGQLFARLVDLWVAPAQGVETRYNVLARSTEDAHIEALGIWMDGREMDTTRRKQTYYPHRLHLIGCTP